MQGEKQYKTGLDVGSTTAKIVIIDESGQTVFSRYERHNAQVNDLLSAYFREARQELGDIETSIAVTGSVGMGTAEQLRTEFIQEVVARHPVRPATISICFGFDRHRRRRCQSRSLSREPYRPSHERELCRWYRCVYRPNGRTVGSRHRRTEPIGFASRAYTPDSCPLRSLLQNRHSKSSQQERPVGRHRRLHFPCRRCTNHRNIIARLDIPPAYSIMRRPLDLHSSLTKSIRRLSAFAGERLYSSCRQKPSSRIRLCPMCHGRKSSCFIDIRKSHIPKHRYHNKKQPASAIRFRNGL